MADDIAPYSGAIEETAKTAGKALDLIKDAAGPIGSVYQLIIGDRIDAARDRRLDQMMRKTRKILKDRNLAETAEVAEQIAIPLLEAAQREPRDEMQELWAQLLANAMDPSRRDIVRPEFIKVLRGFHPTDAVLLQRLEGRKDWTAINELIVGTNIRQAAGVVSMDNLASSSCVRRNSNGLFYAISEFGREFLLACQP